MAQGASKQGKMGRIPWDMEDLMGKTHGKRWEDREISEKPMEILAGKTLRNYLDFFKGIFNIIR